MNSKYFTWFMIAVIQILLIANLVAMMYERIVDDVLSNKHGDITIVDQTPNTLIVRVNSSCKQYYIVSKLHGLDVIEMPDNRN